MGVERLDKRSTQTTNREDRKTNKDTNKIKSEYEMNTNLQAKNKDRTLGKETKGKLKCNKEKNDCELKNMYN